MHNRELRKRAEKLYDYVNNAPPVSFNFKFRDDKEIRDERINFRLPKIYCDMIKNIAKDNKISVSDALNEILYYFRIDYENAREDLRRQKEVWLNQFDNLSEKEQRELIENSIVLAQSPLTDNLLNKKIK